MKKKLLIVFSIVFMCAICFFGCGVAPLNAGPSNNDPVYGNGGFSVIKGDYLYFSNAYADYNDLKEKENKYDFNSSKKVYGIYRAKLNANKLVELDEEGFPVGAELMVPQIGAYAYSGLYICGDYLYYTTPHTGNDNGNYIKGLISFERVNLDRTGHKVILEMTSYSSSCKYNINYIDGVTYISVLDTNSNIILVSVKGENIKNKTIASGVVDFASPEQSEISANSSIDNNDKYVYYTKKIGNYYSLYRKSMIDTNEDEQILIESSATEIKLVSVKNSRVYYKDNNILKSSSFKNNEEPKVYTTQTISDENENGIKSFYILDDTNGTKVDRGVACVSYDGTNYSVNIYNGTAQFLFSNSNQINILYIVGNSVYYKVAEDEALYCYSILSGVSLKVVDNFVTSVDDENTAVYDFNLYHGFYFNTVESAGNSIKYLHMVNLNGFGYTDESSNPIGHYIGVLDASKVY